MSEVVVFMFHSFFFWGGGGGAHISLFEFDTFCDAAPLYFTSV